MMAPRACAGRAKHKDCPIVILVPRELTLA